MTNHCSIEDMGLETVPIPYCYVWLTEGYHDRKNLFRQYVQGYIKKNEPDLLFVRIEGLTAICKKK
ncbi:hypothetical protein ABES38_11610 [Bacillus gobiensis]|uniref:hypothetical protein n=1 Tax=Bacillus gobiensis TaxID=1441095 RepID=UPI003D1FAF90